MNFKIPIEPLPDGLIISNILIEDEIPVVKMKNAKVRAKNANTVGASFHEKKEKNQKVNQKVKFKDKMMLKYGKPKTRGQKVKGK